MALVLAVALAIQGAGRADSRWRRRVVDLTHLDVLHRVPLRYAKSLSSDGTAFAVHDNSLVRLIDSHGGRELQVLEGHEAIVHDSCWSRDGRLVATTGFDETVRIWDAATGKQRIVARPFAGYACSAAFSPDGRRLAVGSGDGGRLQILDVETGAAVREVQTPDASLFALEYSPDGRFLAVNHSPTDRVSPSVRIYKVSDFTEVKTAIAGSCSVLAISRDGSRFAYADASGAVVLMETAAWTELRRIPAHQSVVTGLSFHPDGRHLASAGQDGAVRIWDTWTGKAVNTLPLKPQLEGKVSFSSDGETLLVGSAEATVKVYGRRAAVSAGPTLPPAEPAGK